MLELKVSRCCELSSERQLSAVLFIGKSCNNEYVAVVIINDTLSPSYTATCWLFLINSIHSYHFILRNCGYSLN